MPFSLRHFMSSKDPRSIGTRGSFCGIVAPQKLFHKKVVAHSCRHDKSIVHPFLIWRRHSFLGIATDQKVLNQIPPIASRRSTQCPIDSCLIGVGRSEEHTSELQSQSNLVCRLLLEKKKK